MEKMKSLFGDTISAVPAVRRTDKAHAAKPGTGPEGERCGTCRHAVVSGYHSKNYWKCGLMRTCWTGGGATDIRLKDAACKLWEEKNADR